MKKRHIKTFLEKYSNDDVHQAAIEYRDANRKKLSPTEMFEGLPYIGVMYIHVNSDYAGWWYDSNDDFIKAKIMNVTEDRVYHAHYDSHHHDMVILSQPHAGFVLEGNVLKMEQ